MTNPNYTGHAQDPGLSPEIPPSDTILRGYVTELTVIGGAVLALFVADGGEWDGLSIWSDPIESTWERSCFSKATGMRYEAFGSLEAEADGYRVSGIAWKAIVQVRRKKRGVPGIRAFLGAGDLDRMEAEQHEAEREARRKRMLQDLDAEIYGEAAYAEHEPVDLDSLGDLDVPGPRGQYEEIAGYLEANPEASANAAWKAVGGKKQNVLAIIRSIREEM